MNVWSSDLIGSSISQWDNYNRLWIYHYGFIAVNCAQIIPALLTHWQSQIPQVVSVRFTMSNRGLKKERKFYILCWKAIVKLSVVIRALIVRALFVAFIFLAVWNVVIVKSNDFYWLLLGCAIPFAAEVLYACKVIFIEKKDSSKIGKWFSPVVLLFLCSACPTIWIIEISIWHQYQPIKNVSNPVNKSIYPTTQNSSAVKLVIITLEFTLNVDSFQQRKPTSPAITTPEFLTSIIPSTFHSNRRKKTRVLNVLASSEEKRMIERENRRREIFEKVENAWKKISPENRVRMIEQFLLLCLIFARWLLPRAGITRQQLSQLLLVNIGMGADILELFEAFKEPVVRQDFLLTVSILSLWQASLLQFCLTKTATKVRKIRGGFSQTLKTSDSWIRLPGCLFCETELWAISTSVLLQDGPFLILRVVLIVQYYVASYSNIFFTCKNTLVILLQMFRIGVILFEHRAADVEYNEELSCHKSRRSTSMFGDTASDVIQKQVSTSSLGVYPTTSIHSLFHKKNNNNNNNTNNTNNYNYYNNNLTSQNSHNLPRSYSHNQMCPTLSETLSSII